MSFEQILAVRISVIILNKKIISDIVTKAFTIKFLCMFHMCLNQSAANLADVGSIVSGLQKLGGIRREIVSVHELLSAGFVLFLCNYSEGKNLFLL